MKVDFCSKSHFEVLKGIAILAVLISHAGNFSGKTWFTPLGGIGVALFLFCSGYGTYCTLSSGEGGFWRRRIIKVYVPYVIIEMIVGVVLGRDVLSVLFGLTLIRICHPYGWYLQWLFAWYLLAYVMIRFVKNQRVVTICLIGISIVCLIFHTNLRAEQAFSFSSGMILAMNRVYIKQIEDQQKKLIGIIFLVIGVGMFGFRQTAYVRVEHMELYKYINLVMKLSLAYSILIGVYFVCIGNKVWKWVGKYAYALYLLHAYFIFIISNNLCGNFILNTAIFLAISFLAAIGMIKLIDKFDYLLKYYLVT